MLRVEMTFPASKVHWGEVRDFLTNTLGDLWYIVRKIMPDEETGTVVVSAVVAGYTHDEIEARYQKILWEIGEDTGFFVSTQAQGGKVEADQFIE